VKTGRSKQILEVDFSGDSGANGRRCGAGGKRKAGPGGHVVFLGHGNSVMVDGAHFSTLGTDAIFCSVKKPTVITKVVFGKRTGNAKCNVNKL
jgi:hypothetical protein